MELERNREKKNRLKYIELLKRLPAVRHCHLTRVAGEGLSYQPLGGHLLPHTHARAHTHLYKSWCYHN